MKRELRMQDSTPFGADIGGTIPDGKGDKQITSDDRRISSAVLA